MICTASQGVAQSLRDCGLKPGAAMRAAFNRRYQRSWDIIRDFLAIHYKYNTRMETPFWQACVADVDICGAAPIVEFYRENGPSVIWRDALIDVYDQFKYDGWLTMLIGMQVPHSANYTPSEQEWKTWREVQQVIRRKAEAAMTCEEAFRIIYSPAWRWNPDFFKGVNT